MILSVTVVNSAHCCCHFQQWSCLCRPKCHPVPLHLSLIQTTIALFDSTNIVSDRHQSRKTWNTFQSVSWLATFEPFCCFPRSSRSLCSETIIIYNYFGIVYITLFHFSDENWCDKEWTSVIEKNFFFDKSHSLFIRSLWFFYLNNFFENRLWCLFPWNNYLASLSKFNNKFITR